MGSAPFCRETYLIREEDVNAMTSRIQDSMQHTKPGDSDSFQLYRWQERNNPMAAPAGATSISPKAQGAKFHMFSPRIAAYGYGDLSDTSYFSESPYVQSHDTWKQRYWG